MNTEELKKLSQEITQGEWTSMPENTQLKNGSEVLVIEIRPIVPTGRYRGEIARIQDSTCIGPTGIGVKECEANALAVTMIPKLIAEVLELRKSLE